MAKIVCLSDCSEWINLDFVERERTPSELMKLVFDYIKRYYHYRIQL